MNHWPFMASPQWCMLPYQYFSLSILATKWRRKKLNVLLLLNGRLDLHNNNREDHSYFQTARIYFNIQCIQFGQNPKETCFPIAYCLVIPCLYIGETISRESCWQHTVDNTQYVRHWFYEAILLLYVQCIVQHKLHSLPFYSIVFRDTCVIKLKRCTWNYLYG